MSLLQALLKWEFLKELIIIDNAPDSRPNHHCMSQCIILEQKKNIYVNPAWNLGVHHSSGNVVAICNDDIVFEPQKLNACIQKLKFNEVIGLHEDSILNSQNITQTEVRDGFNIGLGWGCLMLMKRSSYIHIPPSIKIWYGDDWIVHCTGIKKSIRIPVMGTLSVSASDPKFNPTKVQDKAEYEAVIWHPIYRGLRILCRLGFKTPFKIAMNRRAQVGLNF